VAGPLIGLMVPALLVVGNRLFGFSSNFRHVCAVVSRGQVEFFRYDWRTRGLWNLLFLVGTLAGAMLAARFLGLPAIELSEGARGALANLGIAAPTGYQPSELFSWAALGTARGLLMLAGGGFLIGFGTAYAGGCTSGHAIAGLAAFERASLVAVLGFFAGGLITTFLILPVLL
jgi:uncharacterized membrane protein YedE/YeeE